MKTIVSTEAFIVLLMSIISYTPGGTSELLERELKISQKNFIFSCDKLWGLR